MPLLPISIFDSLKRNESSLLARTVCYIKLSHSRVPSIERLLFT